MSVNCFELLQGKVHHLIVGGLLLCSLGVAQANEQGAPNTKNNPCLRLFIEGTIQRQSPVEIKAWEWRDQIDGAGWQSRAKRIMAGGLGYAEHLTVPFRRGFSDNKVRKYKQAVRLIYDAFDNEGDLPRVGVVKEITPEDVAKFAEPGTVLNEVFHDIQPYTSVHGLYSVDDLKTLIREASHDGSLCPYGTRPSMNGIKAMIGSGILKKLHTAAQNQPGVWLMPAPQHCHEESSLSDHDHSAESSSEAAGGTDEETSHKQQDMREIGWSIPKKAKNVTAGFKKKMAKNQLISPADRLTTNKKFNEILAEMKKIHL